MPLKPKLLASIAVLFASFVAAVPAFAAEKFAPRVMILTTFEDGADTGDAPGELQDWVEREHLTSRVSLPGLEHAVLYNDQGVFAMVTGTCNRSGLAMMALGLDPRFDPTHTYFMMAGIAGVDADQASVGSAAWAQWVVDGDNANEIDGHDTPGDWPYGILPYGSHRPDEAPGPRDWSQKPMAFQLNPRRVRRLGLALLLWARSPHLAKWLSPQTFRDRSGQVSPLDRLQSKAHAAVFRPSPAGLRPIKI